MEQQSIQFKLAPWIKANFLGWLLGVILILILSSFLDSIGIEHMQFYLGVGMGGGVGIAQWYVLKRIITINKSWIWYSVLGMGGPFIIIELLPLETLDHKIALSITIGALLTGILQYMILKAYSNNAKLWIVTCFMAWILSVGTVFLIDYTKHLDSFIHNNLVLALINFLLILLGGVVMGVITGTGLKRIF